MTRSSYLLVREDLDRSFYALMSDAEPSVLLSSIMVAAGAEESAVLETLQSLAGLERGALLSASLRGDPNSLGRAASRLAEALAVPVTVLDIAHDAGRMAWASPGTTGELLQVAEAALVPADPSERRRRCDAVLRVFDDRDRAAVADRLGDIADRPMSGRDEFGDLARVAAYVDAVGSLVERSNGRVTTPSGAILIVTGALAAYIASGHVPLAALSSLASLGRTTVLLDVSGALAALGTEQLTEATGADLLRATADQLLVPAGDLLLVGGYPEEEVLVRVGAEEHSVGPDGVIELGLRAGDAAAVDVESVGHRVVVSLRGGVGGACVVRGTPVVDLVATPVIVKPARVLSVDAPLTLLPRSASATGGLGGRLLLGDEVEGRLYFSPSEPDSRGWAAAHEAGILAVVSVSPETVLRARAVGIRGLVVGSLSDGEREALSASIDRRVAAGVALAPFGLLILGGRRESESWAAELGKALSALNGSAVRFERHPAGLTAEAAHGGEARPGIDTVVVGGPLAGSVGTWRGLADAQPSDPHGALEINGDLIAIPLGDLQRLTA
jgi:hypothetical protein